MNEKMMYLSYTCVTTTYMMGDKFLVGMRLLPDNVDIGFKK